MELVGSTIKVYLDDFPQPVSTTKFFREGGNLSLPQVEKKSQICLYVWKAYNSPIAFLMLFHLVLFNIKQCRYKFYAIKALIAKNKFDVKMLFDAFLIKHFLYRTCIIIAVNLNLNIKETTLNCPTQLWKNPKKLFRIFIYLLLVRYSKFAFITAEYLLFACKNTPAVIQHAVKCLTVCLLSCTKHFVQKCRHTLRAVHLGCMVNCFKLSVLLDFEGSWMTDFRSHSPPQKQLSILLQMKKDIK